jgi:Fur family ferric uptake transcriptional regulator
MDVSGKLRDRGYRLTRQREVVLGVLEDNPGIPLSPADVHRAAAGKQPEVGLTTVYRTLELFSDLGIAQRVHLHGDSQYYELNSGGHHHHLVCVACGKVRVFEGCNVGELETDIRDRADFLVTSHCLSLFGYCPGCLPAGTIDGR